MCPSADFWPPWFLISWSLIIMLVSCVWKVGFLLFLRFFFLLSFRTTPRHINYYSWCVLVKFSLCFSYSRFFLFFPQLLLSVAQYVSSNVDNFQPLFLQIFFSASFSPYFFLDLVPVCLHVWQCSQISEALFIFHFFPYIFQKYTFYWSFFVCRFFFLPSQVCCWAHLIFSYCNFQLWNFLIYLYVLQIYYKYI